MNTAFFAFGFIAELSIPFGFIAIFLGLSASLATVGLALRSAPEGYETESGFHFKEGRASIGESADVSMLRPHNAG